MIRADSSAMPPGIRLMLCLWMGWEAKMSVRSSRGRSAACVLLLARPIAGAVASHAWPLRNIAPALESLNEGVSATRVLYANRDYLWPGAGSRRTDINVCWENPDSAPGA